MIDITILDKPHQIASSWKDITWVRYCEILKAAKLPFAGRLAVYTRLPETTINEINFNGIAYLVELVSFMEGHALLKDLATPYSPALNVDIGQGTYDTLESCKRLAMKEDNPLLAGAAIVKKYTDLDISDMCVLDAYAIVEWIFGLISAFLDNYKRMNDYTPTEEEEEAGIENVSRFGVWGTAVAYARRTNMTPDDVMNRPAVEIYTTLLLDFEESEFKRKLNAIRDRNQKMRNRQ